MLAKIDSKTNKELRAKYNVAGLPTVIVAKPGGMEIDRTLGFVRTDEFIATVDGYHKGIGTLAAMLADESSHASDAAFLYKLGEKLFAHSRTDEADARFAKAIEADPANASGVADDAMMDRASICQKNKNWDGAIAHCQTLMKQFPASELVADAAISVAYFHENAGRKPEAIAAYKEFITRWPESGDVEFAREQIKGLETPAAAY